MLKPKERYANIAEGHLHWIPAPSMKDGEGQTIARGRATGILDGEPVDPNWLEPVLVREGLQN